jgi:hypothetical protein
VSASLGTPVLSLGFDDLGALEEATGLASGYLPLDNDTARPVTVHLSTVSGGTIRAVPGRDGGYAARFPAHRPDDSRRAVLTVTTTDEGDPLGPGTSDFAFGADFTLDEVTEAPEESEDSEESANQDNGNNLIQRGLASDPAQYKIQIDRGRASCRVAGEEGEVIVKSEQPIASGSWYRVSCVRSDDRVTLELDSFEGTPERTAEVGATGNIQLPVATPLVLGGKAAENGRAVAGDSDQFNGSVDNVFFTVDDAG